MPILLVGAIFFAVAAFGGCRPVAEEPPAGRAEPPGSQVGPEEGEMAQELAVHLELPNAVMQGEFVIGVLRVTNTTDQPLEVSARLNLLEGDVRLVVTAPGGRTATVHGISQVDSGLRTVTLGPAQSLESGLFLSYTSVGLTFDQPGLYQLRAEYDPSVRMETVRSDTVSLLVQPPVSEEERALSQLTADEQVMRSIALGGALGDPQANRTLEEIARRFGDRKEGAIARLTLAAGSPSPGADAMAAELEPVFRAHDPIAVAHWLTAVSSVMSPAGNQLAQAFSDYLDRAQDAGAPQVERARRIVQQQPLDS